MCEFRTALQQLNLRSRTVSRPNTPIPEEIVAEMTTEGHIPCAGTNMAAIRPYQASDNICISTWIKYFDKQMSIRNVKTEDRGAHITNYLREEAFTFAIEQISDDEPYAVIQERLRQRFMKREQNSLESFNRLQYYEGDDPQTFFFRKLELGKKANLPSDVVLQGLINATPSSLKRFIKISKPKDPQSYLEALMCITEDENSAPPQDKKSHPSRGKEQKYATTGPRSAQSKPRGQLGASPAVRPDHHKLGEGEPNQRIPPYSCQICHRLGYINQLHFHNVCPNRPRSHFVDQVQPMK